MDAINRLIVELYQSARELPIPEFQQRAVQLVKSVCRIESVLCATGKIHPENGVAFESIFLHNISEEFVAAHDEIAADDILAAETARNAGRVCTFNMRELMPARKYPTVAAFDARFEMQNMLGQLFLDSSIDAINGIFLWRSKINDQFSEDERRLGTAFLPHFIEASTINRLVWLSQLTASTIARRGVRALATMNGLLYTHDAEFIDLLRKEWPEWSPPILPPKLMDALGRTPARKFNGKRISVAASLDREMLLLLAREKHGMAGLTHQELVVARLIANGKSQKQAASELNLSVATVRNHMQAVYNKVGVRKPAALARWFNDRTR